MGPHCHFYPTSRVWAPWNLTCEDQVTAGDYAEIYNPRTGPSRLSRHTLAELLKVSCCGIPTAHDFDDPAFPLIAFAMEVAPYAWICARACVAPGVQWP